MSERGQNRVYRQIFRDEHGDGPYTCTYEFCPDRRMVDLEVVHHVDEDPSNNKLSNLQPMHTDCHSKYHHIGLVHTETDKQKIADGLRRAFAEGRRQLPDISGERNPFYGRKHSPEARAKISAARRARVIPR